MRQERRGGKDHGAQSRKSCISIDREECGVSVHHQCAIALPALEGPTVRQEATRVAAASSLAADSEGYEVYYSTNWFIRTLECFTR